MQIIDQSAKMVAMTPLIKQVIERAGRICYKSECKDPEAFIRKIIARGHESVLEHGVATVHIVTDRGVSHELVRHRLCAYSQESTRYCNYESGITFIRTQHDVSDICRVAEETYKTLIKSGVPPQYARNVLPTCLKTELYVTANMRQWRHMMALRLDAAAHPQIRELFSIILDVFLANGLGVFFEEYLCYATTPYDASDSPDIAQK